ncbi:MAG: transposase [Pseudomonadota bacterium]|uniref:REP-associated tyrosine transposase n=1 Tax=Polaromonas sp. YR568 TaxID=1855301 RepID=UPI0027251220|nr:transposase [Polaromonas sp.]MDO9258682.1 transposase [Polaromonas sp.]
MARLPRLSLPGYPHHVILRGNNRQAIFSCPADYQTLLDLIEEHARKSGVAVHAYVLMSNHFHLLVTPEAADSLSRMMQAVGRRYVRYFNDRQGRSGTLWEGRYRSTPIQAETYLLTCMAYMDLNPVRAGLVAEARDYPWSSHGHYIGLRSDRLVTPHPLFWTLGNTPFAREAAYADMVRVGVSASQQAALTESALSGWALGNADFLTDLQKRTERRVVKTRVGRPARKADRP